MNNSGDAAEQVVRLSLEGFEVVAKVSGEAAKNVAVLLLAALKQEQKAKGKARLSNLIKSGKELKVFSIPQKDLKKFTEQAKSTEKTDKNPSLSRTEKDSLSESSSKAINDKDAKDKKQSVKELLDGYKDEIKADRAKEIADKSKTVADTVVKSAKSIKER